MMTPRYPGTNIEMRPTQPSEPEQTPRNERVLQVVREAEEQRISDLAQVNARLEKVESVTVRMVEHLDADEKRRVKRNRRIKWITVTVGAPVLVAVVGSGAAAWTQILVQSRATASAVATHTVQSAQPSTEDLVRTAEERGRQIEYERWQQWQIEHPLPIAKQETIAARGKGR